MAKKKIFQSNRDTVRVAPLDTATLSYLLILLGLLQLLGLPQATAGPRYSSRIVDTQSGGIRGIILEPHSRHLEPVEAFLGVPYAISDRLKPPKPPPRWEGTKLADAFGPVCPQKYPDLSNRTAALMNMPKGRYQQLKKMIPLLTNQSEDCLYLNIYVPGSGNRGFEAPYAVIVWIHGDSYEWGSGNPYDGSVLASHGHVIVLTLNFRLGLLGFLKTRSGNKASVNGGNLALKDIAAALRWAKHNLPSFGGDISRLTIMGHGTGAALANLLLLTTEAKGLIHRMVLLSGSALSPWAMVHDPDSLRSSVAEQLGCNIEFAERGSVPEDDDITECLSNKPLEALLDVRIEETRFIPRWGPHHPIEPEALDPAHSMEASGDSFITCAILMGVATTESYYDFSATDTQYGFEEEYRNRVLRTFIRNSFVYHLNEIYAAVRNEYTDWDKPIQHPINIRDSTMEALSDGHTAAPMLKVALLHARRGATTYFYHFAYQTKEGDYPQRLGSVRGEQVGYVFGLPLVGGLPYFPANYSRQDATVSEALLSLMVTFAKVGDPNGRPGDPAPPQYADYGREKTQFKGVEWQSYDPGNQRYLAFGLKPKMKSHYRGHKMALWLNLIPQLHKPGASDVSMRHHHFREKDPRHYTGPVRPESFTLLYTRMSGILGKITPTECQPIDEDIDHENDDSDDEDQLGTESNLPSEKDIEMLQKLANKHYYSYTAALGITVGIGCILLILNMIIFAGIYYQRGRVARMRRERLNPTSEPASSNHSTSESSIQMRDRSFESTQLPSPIHEPPPLYRPMVTSNHLQVGDSGTLRSQKKRVQIQEISV